MHEQPPKIEQTLTKEALLDVLKELSERTESIPFKGLDEEAYAKLKAEEEEYPGMATPIDELLKRFDEQGLKVMLGKDPKSGNAFILPFESTDVEMDSVQPGSLKVREGMDPLLVQLINHVKAKMNERKGKK